MTINIPGCDFGSDKCSSIGIHSGGKWICRNHIEHALAEKDLVIAGLKEIIQACNKDNLSDAVMNAIIERNDLLRVALKFAKDNVRGIKLYQEEARAFLATPAATALQQAKETT